MGIEWQHIPPQLRITGRENIIPNFRSTADWYRKLEHVPTQVGQLTSHPVGTQQMSEHEVSTDAWLRLSLPDTTHGA